MSEELPKKILILDPASPEFNRGSFCYLPYILSAYYRTQGVSVELWEGFCGEHIDDIKADSYDLILCALWSYPQVDICHVLARFGPRQVRFFGYSGLIQWASLPEFVVAPRWIKLGIEEYFFQFGSFTNILLSDCDMHMVRYSGQVYPLFTSYGCPKGCKFCPTSKNCGRQVLYMDWEKVSEVLRFAAQESMWNIHFTDEDFFLNKERAHRILREAYDIAQQAGGEFRFIALAAAKSLHAYLKKYSYNRYVDQVKIAEVGYESSNLTVLRGMGKAEETRTSILMEVQELFRNQIFWLTMTFFPGETIESLRETGEWLRKYGTPQEQLYDRVKGNSTYGGLGQFFQPYPDTISLDQLAAQGEILSTRPIRLLPSFVPYTFTRALVRNYREPLQEELFWFSYYRVAPPPAVVGQSIETLVRTYYTTPMEGYVAYAIAAKIGVIE